jgi:hypothetical protein
VRRVIGVVVAVLAVGACANDPYDPGALRAGLVDAGLAADEAACLVRQMERWVGVERLGARDEPSEREALVTAILHGACRAAGDDARSLRTALVDTGVDARGAACVVRGLERGLGPARLTTGDAPDDRERRALRVLAEDCLAPPSP